MRFSNITIVFFILLFTGAYLCAHPGVADACKCDQDQPVETYVDEAEGIYLGDGICQLAELNKNLAMEVGPYCIELLLDESGTPWTVVDSEEDEPAPGCTDPTNCRKKWTYRSSIQKQKKCKTVKDWSHLTMVLKLCGNENIQDYILGVDPGEPEFGPIGKDEPSCGVPVNDAQQFLKWSPDVRCCSRGKGWGRWVDYSIYATLDSGQDPCTITNVKRGRYCDSDFLLGPGCGIDITQFVLGPFSAELDPCTGDPVEGTVFIGENEATEVITWFCDPKADGTACNPIHDEGCVCYPLSNSGPPTGTVFKSNTNPTRGCIGSRCFR